MTLYRLTCDCGNTVTVSRSQAGLTVPCACGRQVNVPTLRDLAQYGVEDQPTTRPKGTWGPRQGFIFLGLLVAAVGIALALWCLGQMVPSDPTQGWQSEWFQVNVDALTPEQLLSEMRAQHQGLDATEPSIWDRYQAERNIRQIWFGLSCALAVLGGAMAATAFFWPDARR